MEKHGNALRYELAAAILPSRLRRIAMEQPEEVKEHAEEFRLRAGRCMSVLLPAGEQSLEIIVTVEELETLCDIAAEFSRYASIETLRQGFLPVRGGPVGDRIGRKYVIWVSILGAAPFALLLPYAGLAGTIVLAVVVGLVISSAFSAIVVYATDLMPGKVGMVAGLFFGLMFGLGGIGSAFFGWLADRTSLEFIFRASSLLPLLGIITGLLPDVEARKTR